MKFLAGMETELLSRHEFTEGNMAVVTTLTRMRGMYRGKTVDNRSTETLVLNRIEGQWKIIHVHWSSR
jgi:ketosteroid isomerase-like protein